MKPGPRTRWLALALAAAVAVALVGVQSARQTTQMRESFARLAALRQQEDDYLSEYRLLLLERATFAGYQNVERVAAAKLDMGFPEAVVRVRRPVGDLGAAVR